MQLCSGLCIRAPETQFSCTTPCLLPHKVRNGWSWHSSTRYTLIPELLQTVFLSDWQRRTRDSRAWQEPLKSSRVCKDLPNPGRGFQIRLTDVLLHPPSKTNPCYDEVTLPVPQRQARERRPEKKRRRRKKQVNSGGSGAVKQAEI